MADYVVKIWDFAGGPVVKVDVEASDHLGAAAEAARMLGETFWGASKVDVLLAAEESKDVRRQEVYTIDVETVRDWLQQRG